MKNIIKFLTLTAVLFSIITACENKVDSLPFYKQGSASTLTSSVNTIAATPADSLNSLLTLKWTNPNYSNLDTSKTKYIIEFDSTGRNFLHSVKFTYSGVLVKSFTGNEINAILFNLGLNVGYSYPLDIRITSSYANNNEGLYSNILHVNASFLGATNPVLTSSVASIIPIDSKTITTEGVKFSWTNANYFFKSNTSNNAVSYTLQMDKAGSNFSSSMLQNVAIDSTQSFVSFTQKYINRLLLKAGYPLGVSSNVEFRLVAKLAGIATTSLASNVIKVSATPINKPAIDPPASGTLFLVGSATQGGWSNPVPVPSQQFAQIDSVTYGGVFNLIGGSQYLILPVNGDWGHKYGGTSATGGTLLVDGDVPGSNTPSPTASGWYSITVNFQDGIYTVTPYTSTFPTNLFIVGDATADGWSNSNPAVNPAFTQLDAARFQLTVPLIGGKSYLMLPVAGSWANKYAVADGTVPSSGGRFGYNLSTNFNSPATSGTYTITANFYDFTFTVK